MYKTRVFIMAIVFCCIALISGCGYTIEEKKEMRMFEKTGKNNAIEYIESKYGFTPKILEVKCKKKGSAAVPNLFPEATGDVYVEMSYNGKKFWTFINGEEHTTYGYDNYQAEDIRKAFLDQMEKLLNCNVERFRLGYGLDVTREIDNREYGLVNNYYDGKNLKNILEDSRCNIAEIVYVLKKDSNIEKENVFNNFGENATYLLVNCKDTEAANSMRDFKFEMYENNMDMNIHTVAIYIRDYTLIKDADKKYVKYNIEKFDNFYYMLEEGTYCNFEKTKLDHISNWNGRGFLNAKQIYNGYSIYTDAQTIDIWIPMDKLGVKNPEIMEQFDKNWDTVYAKPISKIIGKNEYLNARIYSLQKYDDFKFSVAYDLGD